MRLLLQLKQSPNYANRGGNAHYCVNINQHHTLSLFVVSYLNPTPAFFGFTSGCSSCLFRVFRGLFFSLRALITVAKIGVFNQTGKSHPPFFDILGKKFDFLCTVIKKYVTLQRTWTIQPCTGDKQRHGGGMSGRGHGQAGRPRAGVHIFEGIDKGSVVLRLVIWNVRNFSNTQDGTVTIHAIAWDWCITVSLC